MHKQNGAAVASSDNQKDSCCGTADCCKDGKCAMGEDYCKDKDSCPMKKNADKQTVQTMDTSKITVVSSAARIAVSRAQTAAKAAHAVIK